MTWMWLIIHWQECTSWWIFYLPKGWGETIISIKWWLLDFRGKWSPPPHTKSQIVGLWLCTLATWHHSLGKALRSAEASCMCFSASCQEVPAPQKFAPFSRQILPCNIAWPRCPACLWEHCDLSYHECSVGYESLLLDFSCRNTIFETRGKTRVQVSIRWSTRYGW